MLFLEQTVNQIINEEGQLILSLTDLGITWEKLEGLFINTFEQAKKYISIYTWDNEMITNVPTNHPDYLHIKHLTYNTAYNMQRFMPDMPGQYWEFNPYTKDMSSLIAGNFSAEIGRAATCEQLEYSLNLGAVKKNVKKAFKLPFAFDPSSIVVTNSGIDGITTLNVNAEEVSYASSTAFCNNYLEKRTQCICCNTDESTECVEFTGDATGSFDNGDLSGYLKFNKDYENITIKFITKYVGIKELDLSCELFYTWYKANMLTMIGRIKKQIDMSQSGIPFDLSQDGLLERSNELHAKVEELKCSKSHWSNF